MKPRRADGRRGFFVAPTRPEWLLLGACLALAAVTAATREPPLDEALARALPGDRSGPGYVTSGTCQACHPSEYATWRGSYHRTMTQVATPDAALAPFEDVVLESRGFEWRLERRGDELWARMPDPVWFEQPVWLMQALDERWPDQPPVIEARVVMSTGSHHMQTYWVRRPGTATLADDDGSLIQLPWVWLIDEGRWVPNQDSFLTPPSPSVGGVASWNANCSQCHSVGTAPGPTSGGERFETRTAELGIACEACHGPAERHVEHYRAPWRRYLRYLRLARGDDPPDPTVVNPAKLTARRTNEVCGQCHSFGEWRDQEGYLAGGIPFHPGEDLEAYRRVFRYGEDLEDAMQRSLLDGDSLALDSRFWRDGTNRVAGREYNAVIASTHHGRSELTCLSCHSMHGYADRDAQLLPGADGDGACLGCHEDFGGASAVEQHTRHAPGSPGAACMNCHMPRTTYGLFTAMRSHRIDSPSLTASLASGRPNACNLCHLDRTLAWTDDYLREWYEAPPAPLGPDERSVAAAPLWMLRGDAAERTIVAWHLGWEGAREASGEDWMPPFLAQLLTDPYAATRQVAYRSLKSLDGYADFSYDYVGSAVVRGGQADQLVGRWLAAGGAGGTEPALLFRPDGAPDTEAWLRLLARRDQRPVTIRE